MSDLTLDLAEEQEPTKGSKHLGWALVLICTAQLMVVLDATIANIAMPPIGRDLDITGANLTWIVTAYALAFGGFLLLGGRLGDLYGRRRAFMVGLVVFALASLLGGLAQNEAMLLSSRALQGLGAALASPAALSLITTTFAPGPQRNRAMAMYATMSGVGSAIGLILGGWLTDMNTVLGLDVHGWRLTFLINVPIGLVAAFLAPRILPESERGRGQLDVPGALAGTAGLVALVFGLTRAGESDYGWDHVSTVGALVAAGVLLAAFIVIETRVAHPLLPFRIFANRTRAASFVAMMLMPAAMFSMFFFLSLYMQTVVGYDAIHTGFAFLPFCVGMIFSAGLVSNLVTRIDPRYIAGIGTLLAASALYGFSRLTVDDSASAVLAVAGDPSSHLGDSINYWTDVMPFVFVMAVGMGAVFVPLTLTAVHHLRHEDAGIGSGVLNTMQQVGGALGLAVLSTVGAHYLNAHEATIRPGLEKAGLQGDALDGLAYLGSFPTGATHGFLVGTFLMLGASLVIWLFLNVRHQELQDAEGHGGVHIG